MYLTPAYLFLSFPLLSRPLFFPMYWRGIPCSEIVDSLTHWHLHTKYVWVCARVLLLPLPPTIGTHLGFDEALNQKNVDRLPKIGECTARSKDASCLGLWNSMVAPWRDSARDALHSLQVWRHKAWCRRRLGEEAFELFSKHKYYTVNCPVLHETWLTSLHRWSATVKRMILAQDKGTDWRSYLTLGWKLADDQSPVHLVSIDGRVWTNGYGSKLSIPKMDGFPTKHDHSCGSLVP